MRSSSLLLLVFCACAALWPASALDCYQCSGSDCEDLDKVQIVSCNLEDSETTSSTSTTTTPTTDGATGTADTTTDATASDVETTTEAATADITETTKASTGSSTDSTTKSGTATTGATTAAATESTGITATTASTSTEGPESTASAPAESSDSTEPTTLAAESTTSTTSAPTVTTGSTVSAASATAAAADSTKSTTSNPVVDRTTDGAAAQAMQTTSTTIAVPQPSLSHIESSLPQVALAAGGRARRSLPAQAADHLIRNYRAYQLNGRAVAYRTSACYSIEKEGHIQRGCVLIPQGQTGCQAVREEVGLPQDSVGDLCDVCQMDRCNGSAKLRLSLASLLLLLVLGLKSLF